jgi:hypothetical protein
MDKLIETAIFTRKSLVKIMETRNYEDLVKIPDNFRNSIFWNIAHLLVTQQLLCYKLSGQDLRISEEMVAKYGKGSLANEEVSKKDIEYVKENLLEMVIKMQEDYEKGLFVNYKPYMTSANIELCNIEDALKFSAYHDGIHLGVILSLMKIV